MNLSGQNSTELLSSLETVRCYWRTVSCINRDDDIYEITVEISDGRGCKNMIDQSIIDEQRKFVEYRRRKSSGDWCFTFSSENFGKRPYLDN